MKLSRQEIAVICITAAFVLIVCGALLAVFGVFSNGFSEGFTTIYLTSGGVKFFGDNTDARLGNVQFKVYNAWKSNSDYTVKVLPTGEDFYYEVDGKWYSFLELKDLTPAFNVTTSGSKFIVHARRLTMAKVLSELYDRKEVIVPSESADYTPHFKLVVSNGKDEVTVTFRCTMPAVGVGGVELPPSVLF